MESASSVWFECVEVNGGLVNFKLDTGSDVKILPDQLVLNWNPPPTVKATNAKVTSYLAFSLRLTTNLLSVFSLKTSTRSHPVYNAYYFDFNATA
ncbi:hypothetical protein MRX96_036738 [Rhipicephalus microplus]